MKKCTECNEEKDLDLFHNYKAGKFGKKAKCKLCISYKSKIYNTENKLKIKESKAIQYLKNKDSIIERVNKNTLKNYDKIKTYQSNYRLLNRSKLNKYYVDRNKTDYLFYLKGRIRKSISNSITQNGFNKFLSTNKILGCEFYFFIDYIEAQFTKEMTWKNIHIDHINPLSSAKNEKEILELNHYTNLQPLLAIDNLKKGVKKITKQLKFI